MNLKDDEIKADLFSNIFYKNINYKPLNISKFRYSLFKFSNFLILGSKKIYPISIIILFLTKIQFLTIICSNLTFFCYKTSKNIPKLLQVLNILVYLNLNHFNNDNIK